MRPTDSFPCANRFMYFSRTVDKSLINPTQELSIWKSFRWLLGNCQSDVDQLQVRLELFWTLEVKLSVPDAFYQKNSVNKTNNYVTIQQLHEPVFVLYCVGTKLITPKPTSLSNGWKTDGFHIGTPNSLPVMTAVSKFIKPTAQAQYSFPAVWSSAGPKLLLPIENRWHSVEITLKLYWRCWNVCTWK